MTVELNNKDNEFVVYILNALHLDIDQFNKSIANGSDYELIIDSWCFKLMNKGMSPKKALKLIFRARNLYLLSNDKSVTRLISYPSLNRYRFLKLFLAG